MAFNATGDCQIVLQTYKYKKQHIICRTKVLPSLVTHFGKKSNDYHWMTPASWTNIESGLWGLFEKEQDTVQSVHAELLIEHIKVRVDSTENRHSYSQKLLPGVTMSENDLYLNVQLEYVPQEATTTIGKGIDSTSKGREVATSKASDHEAHKYKHKSSRHGHGSRERKQTKQTHISRSVFNARRSTSEESEKEKSSKRSRSSREKKPTKRTHSSRSIDKQAERTRETGKSPNKMHSAPKSIAQYFEKDESLTRCRSSTKRPNTPESENSSRKIKTNKFDYDDDEPIAKNKNANKNATAPAQPEPGQGQPSSGAFAALEKFLIDDPCPRKVKILLMDKMGKEEVLSTFSKYKCDLDNFFKEHRISRTDNFMSIQHVHIIDIVKRNISEAMLARLGKVYGTNTAYASLVINALLPLWIARLFMDTFNFGTAEEAVRQIKDQLAYSTYLNALNNEPLESDLEMW